MPDHAAVRAAVDRRGRHRGGQRGAARRLARPPARRSIAFERALAASTPACRLRVGDLRHRGAARRVRRVRHRPGRRGGHEPADVRGDRVDRDPARRDGRVRRRRAGHRAARPGRREGRDHARRTAGGRRGRLRRPPGRPRRAAGPSRDAAGARLLVDAAHSIGSPYHGRPVGSTADITTFSFFPTKNMTTAEGGAVATTDPETRRRRARRFRSHGLVRDRGRAALPGRGRLAPGGARVRPQLPAARRAVRARCRRSSRRLDAFRDAARPARRPLPRAARRSRRRGACRRSAPDVEPSWHLYPLRVPRRPAPRGVRQDARRRHRRAGQLHPGVLAPGLRGPRATGAACARTPKDTTSRSCRCRCSPT